MAESPYRVTFSLPRADFAQRVGGLRFAIGGGLVPAFRVSCRKAPPRRRPKRVAKKLANRGGYMRHASMGALIYVLE